MNPIPTVRPAPCRFCPYRRDVPSGVWHESEYRKLEEYDAETGSQPLSTFSCHELTGMICAGWAQCHGWELLGLRIAAMKNPNLSIPAIMTPIWGSGRAASRHGRARMNRPTGKALAAIRYLVRLKLRKTIGKRPDYKPGGEL